MPDFIKTVSELTFSCADREAKWLNRYNKDSKDLEWAYKEGFYQTRIAELLGLIPEEYLEKIQGLLLRKMANLPGEAEQNRSPEEVARFIHDLQRSADHPTAEAPSESVDPQRIPTL